MNQSTKLLQQISKSISSKQGHSAATHASGHLQAYLTSSCKVNTCIINSGATNNMANNPSSVHGFVPKSEKHNVSIANGITVHVLGSGKVDFFPHTSTFDALVVLSFPVQLRSIG